MMQNIEITRGLVFSSRLLLAMVEKGMSRRDAYKIVQANSAVTWDEDRDFRDLVRSDPEVTSRLTGKELDEIFDYRYYVRYVDETFERAGLFSAALQRT
jgi:adenylosuccinate lyase